MAWPNPLRRRDENTRTCWGYTFQLTRAHLNPERSDSLKYSYDKLGEDCLIILNGVDPPTTAGTARQKAESQSSEKSNNWKPKRDLYRLLETHAEDHPKLQELWSQLNTVPRWVNWDQV